MVRPHVHRSDLLASSGAVLLPRNEAGIRPFYYATVERRLQGNLDAVSVMTVLSSARIAACVSADYGHAAGFQLGADRLDVLLPGGDLSGERAEAALGVVVWSYA